MNGSANAPGSLNNLLERLWQDFKQVNPQADQIHRLLQDHHENIENDHVAFRTFQDKKVGLSKMAQCFTSQGYESKGSYEFKEKKLYAEHFEHTDSAMPKIFISELLVDEFSDSLKDCVKSLVAQVPESDLEKSDWCLLGRPWQISYSQYKTLLSESEYAAWMSAFGFRANHFTVLVNRLKNFDEISSLNQFLKENGFKLNSSGGEIKGGKDVLLEQSSTLAAEIEVDFTDGPKIIPSCYYEFAKRYPQADGSLYQGFVAASADKIFESTNAQKAN